MADSSDLDLKLLDRALDRHASDRQTFARDLKIVAPILLVFLFGIFFRFVDLSDQRLALASRLKDVGEAQATLTQIRDGLGQIVDLLRMRGAEVAEAITRGRDTLHGKIMALNEELKNLRQEGPAISEDVNVPANSPVQAPPSPPRPAPRRSASPLYGLNDEQLSALRQGRGDDYGALIRKIVNERIVPGVFEDLNRARIEKLERPVDEIVSSLAGPLASHNALLEDLGWRPATISGLLDELRGTLHDLNFEPPVEDDWWRTVEAKGREFEGVRADAEQAFARARAELASPTKSLEDLDRTIAGFAADAERDKANLDAQAKLLDEDYSEVQSLMATVAKPLTAVAMDPEIVARYAPAILAATLIYFLMRYQALQRSRASLARACCDLGYSNQVVDVYFEKGVDPVAAVSSTPIGRWLPQKSLGILVFAVPGLLALSAAVRILNSPSLKPRAPWVVYVLTFSALAVTYLVVTPPGRFQTQSSEA